MAKKKKTKAESEYFARIVEDGCIICERPAEVHHNTGAGTGLKSPYEECMPLCPDHHRNGGLGVAIHAGEQTWEAIFGTQEELIIKTRERIGIYD